MIRTTWNSVFTRVTGEIESLSGEIARAQVQATTGLAFSRPSDDPSRVARVHHLSSRAADQETWSQNSGRAASWQSMADAALEQATNTVIRAYELATQMASEVYTTSDRALASTEANGLYEQLLSVVNTEMGGRYLFAGAATDTEPYDAAGTYLGSAAEATTLVGQDIEVTVGFVGTDFFQAGVDVLAVVRDLASALAIDDVAAVTVAVGDLSDAVDQLANARTRVGTEWNMSLDAEELAGNLGTLLGTDLNDETAIDEVEVYSRLGAYQGSYEAALKVLASMRNMNLFQAM